MNEGRRHLLRAVATAGVVVALLAGLGLWAPSRTIDAWREAAVDRLLLSAPSAPAISVLVVDIDDAALAAVGPWPWPRGRLADLVNRIAVGVPRVVGLDLVLAGPDRWAPGRIADAVGGADPTLREALARLPDGDAKLALALSAAPSVLAALFDDRPQTALPPAPLLLTGRRPTSAPWVAAGAVGPPPALIAKAGGLGIASMEGDASGVVRSVPLLGVAGGEVVAGFAAEVVRQAEGAGSHILDGDGPRLRIGDRSVPLDRGVALRFRPSTPERWVQRTVSAAAVLAGEVPPERFEGEIVLVGGSAPALGGRRATAASPLAPSVQIQADAVETILSGHVPIRRDGAWGLEAGAVVLLALLGALAGAALPPLRAAAVTFAAAGAWVTLAAQSLWRFDGVHDPVTPSLAALVALVAAGTHAAVAQRRSAAGIRRRFEQHLDPGIVARIVERPDLVRFEGERREVTALFTDIADFTALTERLGPRELIALLDDYFAGLAAIVMRHGGMIDKFVGDAAHCFFNAPLDLADHPRRAVEAAEEIARFTRDFAATGAAREAGLGRTRIGIETGEVVIGDVGSGAKVDYTAHGSAVNTAARLEGLNKTFGTTICVGPVCRARLPDKVFRLLGAVEVRGRGTLDVYTPDAEPPVAGDGPARG